MRVNLRRYSLILPLAGWLAQVSLEIWCGGGKSAEAEARGDCGNHQAEDDLECAPEVRIGTATERGETPISQSSESVISATRRWQ